MQKGLCRIRFPFLFYFVWTALFTNVTTFANYITGCCTMYFVHPHIFCHNFFLIFKLFFSLLFLFKMMRHFPIFFTKNSNKTFSICKSWTWNYWKSHAFQFQLGRCTHTANSNSKMSIKLTHKWLLKNSTNKHKIFCDAW